MLSQVPLEYKPASQHPPQRFALGLATAATAVH